MPRSAPVGPVALNQSKRHMLPRHSRTIKTLMLAGVILAPATTLAVMGYQAYRAESLLLRDRFKQDQAAIVRLVANRLSEAAENALDDLAERCRNQEPDAMMESRFSTAHSIARHIFLIRDGRLAYPVATLTDAERPGIRYSRPDGYLASDIDVQNYVTRLRKIRRTSRLVDLGIRAEVKGRLKQAERLFRHAARGQGELAAQALLNRARVQRLMARPQEATSSYQELRQRFEGVRDSQGISYALLADVGRAELEPGGSLQQIHQRLLQSEYLTSGASRRFYLRWTVEQLAAHPSVDPALVQKLRSQTIRLFVAEKFGSLLLRHGIANIEQHAADHSRSVVLDPSTTLVVLRKGRVVLGYSLDERAVRRRVATHRHEVVSPGRQISFVLKKIGEEHNIPREQIIDSAVLARPMSNWTLTALFPSADPMDVMERRRGMRRLGLVSGLILTLLVGLILTYLGVRRESELAQLKSDFASNVSHELKTPLTSIRMYAEMLQQGIAATAGDQARYQGVIIRESERLGRLIANVLDFSRLERGTRSYDLQAVDIEELAQEALETFARLSEGESLQIEPPERSDPLPAVVADREAAVQSILNLLSNAAKYSAGPPEITVRLARGLAGIGLSVEDAGIGIPLAEQKRIFEDFFRAPGAREAGVEGTGLGLALVRRHMVAFGGQVEVESASGRGSTFTLWFVEASEKEV